MPFCDHCAGQRFDRARVLRALRRLQKQLRAERRRESAAALALALSAVQELDIPHLDPIEPEDDVVH